MDGKWGVGQSLLCSKNIQFRFGDRATSVFLPTKQHYGIFGGSPMMRQISYGPVLIVPEEDYKLRWYRLLGGCTGDPGRDASQDERAYEGSAVDVITSYDQGATVFGLNHSDLKQSRRFILSPQIGTIYSTASPFKVVPRVTVAHSEQAGFGPQRGELPLTVPPVPPSAKDKILALQLDLGEIAAGQSKTAHFVLVFAEKRERLPAKAALFTTALDFERGLADTQAFWAQDALALRTPDKDINAALRWYVNTLRSCVYPTGILVTGRAGYVSESHYSQDLYYSFPGFAIDPHPLADLFARRVPGRGQ